jgi:hypothetical protein
MMWPLQFAAIRAFGVGLAWQGLVAASHTGAGRRSLSLWNGHGLRLSGLGAALQSGRGRMGRSHFVINASRAV